MLKPLWVGVSCAWWGQSGLGVSHLKSGEESEFGQGKVHKINPQTKFCSFSFPAFLLYTLQVAIAFGLLSSLYGDFMQVS